MKVSLSQERTAFEYFENLIMNQVGVSDCVINERVLILEGKFDDKNASHTVSFLVKSNDSEQEVKLNQQDVALITALCLTVQKVKEVDGQVVPVSPELTFADSAYFPGLKDGEIEAVAVGAAFSAKLTLDNKVNKRLIDFDTRNLLCVPETKVSGEPSYGIGLTEKGYYPLVQPFVVAGSTENKLQLTLPYLLTKVIKGGFKADGNAVTDGSYNVFRFRCRGLVAIDADVAYSKFMSSNRSKF
jgi:hypothetical protein